MMCRHCGKPVFQPCLEDGVWYHDDDEGTRYCLYAKTGRYRAAQPVGTAKESEK